MLKQTVYIVTCPCGTTFTAKRSHATYCSKACRSKAIKQNEELLGPNEPLYPPKRICKVCGLPTANYFKCASCWEAEEKDMYGDRVSRVELDPYGLR